MWKTEEVKPDGNLRQKEREGSANLMCMKKHTQGYQNLLRFQGEVSSKSRGNLGGIKHTKLRHAEPMRYLW